MSQRKSYIIGASIILFFVLLALTLRINRIYQRDLPSLEELHNIEPSLITRIYSVDGKVLQEFYSERRTLTALNRMPRDLIEALIATEDNRFYQHWGVDLLGIGRAFITNIFKGGFVQGGSTITQQLARTLFLTREKTITRKIKEGLTAIKIERTYSKDEILELYLNQSYFGKGAYGIQSAALTYFGKAIDTLTISDCAVLIGILKAPNRYSPLVSPELARGRRNVVLENLAGWGTITKKEADSLQKLELAINPSTGQGGEAHYFTEMVRQYLEEKYGEGALYSGGLSVYTTLNSELQKTAETALNTQLDILQKQMENTHSLRDQNYTVATVDTGGGKPKNKREYKKIHGALVAVDNQTGDILALIGGRDFTQTKFNRAVQALRQPGSAFKPFVYTAAIDEGFKPTDIFYDTPIVLTDGTGNEWKPNNYDREFRGPVTLRVGLQDSRNLVAIKLLQKIGPQKAVDYAYKMGIRTNLYAVPSIAIGTSEVTLLQMTQAFSVFPNQGIKVEPRSILKITDRYGNILEENKTVKRQEVLSRQTAYILTNMLQSVVDKGTGFAVRALGFSRPAGGKTGTTDETTDNWFIGFVPQITAGVWIGYDDKTSIGPNQTGGGTCAPVWTNFMKKATEKLAPENFAIPPGIVFRNVCLESGDLAGPNCPNPAFEVFTEKTEPKTGCHLHPGGTTFLAP